MRRTTEGDALREAVAEMVRDHTMPPNKDRRGYDYRMGWWDAVTFLDSLVKRRVRAASENGTPADPPESNDPVFWLGSD